MTTTLIIMSIVTVVLTILVTGCMIAVWRTTKSTSPEMLPRVFFVASAVKLFTALVAIAAGVFLMRHDIASIRLYTIVTILVFVISLVCDTTYFYCSSKTINNNNN